jgi:hypothetical protein
MLSSPNISSMSVIINVRNAVFLAKQKNQTMHINIAGIQLTVEPNSDPSELVCLWETEFENRKK